MWHTPRGGVAMIPRVLRLHPKTYHRLIVLRKEVERDGAYRVAKRRKFSKRHAPGFPSGCRAMRLMGSRVCSRATGPVGRRCWRSGNENNSETFSTVVRWPTDWIAECGPRRSIARQPLGNPGAWRFENFRQFATGPAFGIQNYGLHPFRHAIGTIPLRFLAQDNQSTIRLRMQSQHARNHGYTSTRSMPHLLV